jgi:hypothetical protein
MEPDCLNLPSPTCFHGLLTATSKRHELLVATTSRPQPLVAWLLPIGPDSNISNIACSNREALFFAKYIFTFSSICIFLFICLTESVRAINLFNYFNGNVCDAILPPSVIPIEYHHLTHTF